MNTKSLFNFFWCVSVFLFMCAPYAVADKTTDTVTVGREGADSGVGSEDAASAWRLYSTALEQLAAGNDSHALELLDRLQKEYPGTEASRRAEHYIEMRSLKLDHSGAVQFYLGNILTSLLVTEGVPVLLEKENPLIYSSLGIAGLGAGVGSARLMTKEQDMSSARALWIDFTQAAAMTNYQLALSAARPSLSLSPRAEEKLTIGGLMTTALAGRSGAYLATGDSELSYGRASLTASSYAWAHMYYWLIVDGIIRSDRPTLDPLMGLIIPDLAAAGSYHLWESHPLSASRIGFLSVGAVGGGLLGIFANGILGELHGGVDPRVHVSVLVGGILLGQGAAYYMTRGMPPETGATAESAVQGDAEQGGIVVGGSTIHLTPHAGPGGWGVSVFVRR